MEAQRSELLQQSMKLVSFWQGTFLLKYSHQKLGFQVKIKFWAETTFSLQKIFSSWKYPKCITLYSMLGQHISNQFSYEKVVLSLLQWEVCVEQGEETEVPQTWTKSKLYSGVLRYRALTYSQIWDRRQEGGTHSDTTLMWTLQANWWTGVNWSGSSDLELC